MFEVARHIPRSLVEGILTAAPMYVDEDENLRLQ